MKKKKKVRRNSRKSKIEEGPSPLQVDAEEVEEQVGLRGWALWTMLAASLSGSGLALYASYHSIQVRWHGLENPSACTVNAWINCDAVQASSHAFLLGIPVGWWGLLYYLWIGILILWSVFRKQSGQMAIAVAFMSSLLALAFTAYKAFTLIFLLESLCLVCVAMYVVNLTLVLVLKGTLRVPIGKIPRRLQEMLTHQLGQESSFKLIRRLILYGITAVAVLTGGAVLAKYLEGNYFTATEVDVETEIAKHFDQPRQEAGIHPKAPIWGNPDATVTLVEYSDFECRYCRRAAFHLRALLWEFRDKVRLYFMNYPLDHTINRFIRGRIHQNAGMAARAAVVAQERGRFWQFHDDLFRSQKVLKRKVILELAEEHGWDRDDFAQSLDSPEAFKRVREDIGFAGRIRSTPWLLINGRHVAHWGHPEILVRIIKEEISRGTD